MDSEEIAALAASFGKAMADGLAANEDYKDAKAEAAKKDKAETAEAKRVAEKRSNALHRVVDVFEGNQQRAANYVKQAIAGYCNDARADALEPLRKDPRMPRSINYLERYSALVGMQDRAAVLERLDATIDLADEILAGAADVDACAAISEAAAMYVDRVKALNGIVVSEADPNPESIVEDDPQVDASAEASSDASDMAQAIEKAFASVMGDLPALEADRLEEVEAAKARERLLEQQIEKAQKTAVQAAESVARTSALNVAGAVYEVGELAGFEGAIIFKIDKDITLVKELSSEVRRSFQTFKQVVQDNGLFAAFASESAYGECKGYRYDWWWDDEIDDEYEGKIPSQETCNDIPTSVKEDKGGDTLEKSIMRMREFNKQKYWGLLDDDFSKHVEAFWYGFKKLMINVNELFELDGRAFGIYCNGVSKVAQSKAAELAMKMDDYQITRFCEEVKNRRRGE